MTSPSELNKRFSIMMIVIFLLTLPTGTLASAELEVDRRLLCGPKCINAVFSIYGKTTYDPLVLAKSLNEFDPNKGTTLRSIASYIEAHGLHCRIVKVDCNSRISWPNPVIVHLTNQSSDSTGHFVVWDPSLNSSADQSVQFYDGVSEYQSLDIKRWNQCRSGVILLTSPIPIDSNDSPTVALDSSIDSPYYLTISLVALGAGVLSVVSSFLFRNFERKAL